MSLSQQNRFTALASSTLDAGHSEPHRLEALRAVVRRAGTVLENAADKDSRLACGPGCAACCSINVTILEPEALAIRDYVDTRFSTDERRRLVEDLEKLQHETCWLDDEERIMARRRCAFLDHRDFCSIHPVRPLLCRSVSSTDPEQCRDALAMLALGEPPRIVCNLGQRRLYEEAFTGLAEALGEHRLDDRGYRLTGKALELLAHEKGRP